MIRISVDKACVAPMWWQEAWRKEGEPASIAPVLFLVAVNEVVVTDEEAMEALSWCQSIDGWEDGEPSHRTPLRFETVA